MQYYTVDPTAQSSWRLAVLMGANTRTYKFALAHALLTMARSGREEVTLAELAVPYAISLGEHAAHYPQAPGIENLGEADYLRVLAEETDSVESGQPSERLIEATTSSMPSMVMAKFHNLRGSGGVPHRFYEVVGRGSAKKVRLTTELHAVVQGEQASTLSRELDARWALVESAFDAEIGRSLVGHGIVVSEDGEIVMDRVRRSQVARSRDALIGFQHGRCLYCQTPLTDLATQAHVDHAFPFSLMRRMAWGGPDLNGIWNLAVSCAQCNLRKSDRLPSEAEIRLLAERNEYIIGSPHPLRRTIQLQAGRDEAHRRDFYRSVNSLAHGH